ncbi:MAG: hypothetical protein KGJ13_12365 [Patescibacteria group bacterium]|nr:hypothetical protein [Patescibacteria group bacterium]
METTPHGNGRDSVNTRVRAIIGLCGTAGRGGAWRGAARQGKVYFDNTRLERGRKSRAAGMAFPCAGGPAQAFSHNRKEA